MLDHRPDGTLNPPLPSSSIPSSYLCNLQRPESCFPLQTDRKGQVGIAYSGYSWKRNALTSAMPAVLTIATCSVQWFVVGYTLAYGEGGFVFGGLEHLFHRGVLAEPVGSIPAILFSEFQLVFEATVCAIAVGGICERGRLLPVVPFIFVRVCLLSSCKDRAGVVRWRGVH